MHSDNALRVDGFYTFPIRIGDNERGDIRNQLGEVLAELHHHDPLMTVLTGDVGQGPIFASKELRQLKRCSELNCANIDNFLQLVRNGRFRGLLIVFLEMHEKRNFEHSPLTPFIKQLIITSPHSTILKDWPLTPGNQFFPTKICSQMMNNFGQPLGSPKLSALKFVRFLQIVRHFCERDFLPLPRRLTPHQSTSPTCRR